MIDKTLVFTRPKEVEYVCPKHGKVTEIVTFTIGHPEKVFCMECILNFLETILKPIEKIDEKT